VFRLSEKHGLRNVKCEAPIRLHSRHRSEIKTLKGTDCLQASELARFELTAYAATNASSDSETGYYDEQIAIGYRVALCMVRFDLWEVPRS
jgi:hypothetical protein